ncbi:MAG: hypothetical protein Wins2KO_17760 [Winogradskyella sp.]
MKLKKIVMLGALAMVLVSCFGDRKAMDIAEMGDTSFVNENFKGNLINYKEGMSGCDKLSAGFLASQYNVATSAVIIEDPTKSDRYAIKKPSCMIHVKMSDQKFDHLTGSIGVIKEVKADEFMGDVAQAAGTGEEWEEAWALKKSLRKSTEWIPNMGKAALWIGAQRTLEVKFDGYTLVVMAPGAPFNDIEKAKNRDYKAIAIAMAKAAGYTN